MFKQENKPVRLYPKRSLGDKIKTVELFILYRLIDKVRS